VDNADYDRVSAYKWSASKTKTNVYGIRKVRMPEGRTTSQLLHRFIVGVTDRKVDVDHKDHDGLNGQRHNLRKCVRGENDGNRRKSRGASHFKGSELDSRRRVWRACIRIERTIHLGYFTDEVQAALAYDTGGTDSLRFDGKLQLCLAGIAHLP
jgi:hypothetical protein